MLDTKPPAAVAPPKTIVADGGRAWFNISAWSIRRPLPAALLFILLMAVGLYAYSRMPVTRYPNVDIPVVMLLLESPGTPASTLEQQVAVPLEQRLKAVDGPRHVHGIRSGLRLADGVVDGARRMRGVLSGCLHPGPPTRQ